MRISIAIMSHPKRELEAKALIDRLNKMPFVSVALVIDEGGGEWPTGKRALQRNDESATWHVVIQDDAIISDTFYDNVERALEAVPEESLVSFYLGQVRPFRGQVRLAYETAKREGKSWVTGGSLYWGVCIAIPTDHIEELLYFVKQSYKLYDARIGSYYHRARRLVYYTTVSLVDHNDDLESLAGHRSNIGKRIAHEFVGDRLLDFNQESQRI